MVFVFQEGLVKSINPKFLTAISRTLKCRNFAYLTKNYQQVDSFNIMIDNYDIRTHWFRSLEITFLSLLNSIIVCEVLS